MTGFDARMAALRQRFIDQAAAEEVLIRTALAGGDWPKLRDLSHGLSGRAGMFGFSEVGDAAQAVEEAIDADATPDERQRLTEQLIGRLDRLAQER